MPTPVLTPIWTKLLFSQFCFSNVIVLRFFIYESKVIVKFLWENGFSIFGEIVDVAKFQLLFYHHFETVHQIYFPAFEFFCCTLTVTQAQCKICLGKCVSEVLVHMDPPPTTTTNGSTEDLDLKYYRGFNFCQQMAVLQNKWQLNGAKIVDESCAQYLCERFARYVTNPTHALMFYL